MKKLNTKGFGTIEIILIILLIGAVSGLGWYVWHSRQVANDSLNNAGQNSYAQPAPINNFEDCKKSKGSKIRESYPEVCVTIAGKSFTNTNQELSKTYSNSEYNFSFRYPENWTLKVSLKDIGRGGNEGDITVTSPTGTKIHFGPNFGGKGGDCWDDQANDHTARTCTTRKIISVQKLTTKNRMPVYLIHASDTDPLLSGGKTHYFVYLTDGYDETPKIGTSIGAYFRNSQPIYVKKGQNFYYLTIYVEGKDDSMNNSPDFFNTREIIEAEAVLKTLTI